jgi:hypothetical protein
MGDCPLDAITPNVVQCLALGVHAGLKFHCIDTQHIYMHIKRTRTRNHT